ncbi:ribokinase [Pseudoxanthomonas helianthi]|uniref:Ribokinase n=1 Tax=Pseudoxanthomonas helianthi TaxID=1453541 RepID=A0A941AUX3_9GAMM|nr:ribokinase [Pseudoxanthomonas helianthi]MBP3985275.1 ribokinase [Pseudoxanthomonas helianthi]
MNKRHLLVAGSANLDFVVRAPHVPAPGETVLGRDFATFPGGKGANQAVACARAGGAPTRMLLALGDDAFAVPLEASLRDAGVEPLIVRTPDQPTGTAFICLSDDAENAITVAPGANNALRAEHLPPLDAVSHLLLQLETPLEAVGAWATAARAAGVKVLLNAAPARSLPESLLAALDVLVVNEGELALLSGESSSVAAGLAKLYVPGVVVTLGARGCIARIDGQIHLQPAFVVQAVDTTAAGDTFCGTLAARLAQGDGIDDALRYASAASAIACTRLGAQSSIPEHGEVEAFLRDSPPFPPQAQQSLAAYCRL